MNEESPMTVPLSDFIRPSKRKLKKKQRFINTKEMQNKSCVAGCHCEEDRHSEFPELSPQSEDPGLPETAVWGLGKGLQGSSAKTDASTVMPARPEAGVLGQSERLKGSTTEVDATVKTAVSGSVGA